MTVPIASLLVVLGIALLLFSFEWVSVDIVALGLLIALAIAGLLPPGQAFAGFGNDTVLMIMSLLILTAALVRTGVVEIVGRNLIRSTGTNPNRMLIVVMSASAGLSALMSNTGATAFFVPIVMGLAQRTRTSASKLLMPLAFSAILASSVTLIGTSTNIVVSGMMTRYDMPPLGMFELTSVGLPIVVIGLIYMYWVGRKLIPDRSIPDQLTQEFDMKPYLTQIRILPGSSLIGQTLAEAALGRDMDLMIVRVMRGEKSIPALRSNIRLQEGDYLLVEGQRDEIIKNKDSFRVGITDPPELAEIDLQMKEMRLAEVIILPRSSLIGRDLVSVGLREQHGIQVLAVNRQEQTIHRKVSRIRLRMGDVLLVQGHQTNLTALERNNTFRVMGLIPNDTPNWGRAKIAIAIFVGTLLLASLELVELPVAVLIGAVLAFLTGCITPEEAYREIEWKAIILIGSMLAFGSAMEYTGTAEFLASRIVSLVGNANPLWLLSGFFLLTVALTQPMSNQSAAVVVLPVAIQAAVQLGLNPRPFAIMIALAASTSFITPLEPACLIVYGLGRYRFMDFFRVGSLLTILVFLIAIVMVPRIWPLA